MASAAAAADVKGVEAACQGTVGRGFKGQGFQVRVYKSFLPGGRGEVAIAALGPAERDMEIKPCHKDIVANRGGAK